MKPSDFISQLKLRYKWIVFFAFTAFVVSMFFYFNISNKSKGEVTILIPLPGTQSQERGASEAERFAFAQQNAVTATRLLNFIYADEMIKHIEGKFNLYDHYNINRYENYGWNLVMKKFKNNVELARQTDEMAMVSFYDTDEIFAADIANEVVAKLILMNRDYALNSIKQRRDLYETVIGQINLEAGGQIAQLKAVMSDFQAQSNMSERNFDKLDNHVNNAAMEIAKLTGELVRIQQFYKWSLIAIDNNFQNNVFIINNAFPFKSPVSYFKIVSVGILSALMVILLFCLLLYLYFYGRSQMETLFTQ